MTLHIQVRFNNRTPQTFDRIIVTATRFVGVMNMGKVVPKMGIELTSPVFQASVLTITPPRVPEAATLSMWLLA